MILEISLAASVILFAVTLYYCLKFAFVIIRVQEVIEESLDIMDEKHRAISEILSRPLFYDSTEVRAVLKDIESTRNAIHNIAFSLSDNFKENVENEG